MTVYVLAQLTVHDRARYDRYGAGFMPVLIQYGGRLLAADEKVETLEGKWDHEKVVLIAFDDRAGAQRWLNSPEYREIAKDRLAATTAVALLVQGL